MSNPKGVTLSKVLTMYFSMLMIYCIDLFAFQSDLKGLGDNFYARAVSIIVLFLVLWVGKESVRAAGISKKWKNIVSGLGFGALFSVVPIVLVIGAQAVHNLINGVPVHLVVVPPNYQYLSQNNFSEGGAIAIFVFSSLIGSFFKETFFRGYLLKNMKKVYGFGTANLLQTVLYTSFAVPMLLRNLINGYYANITVSLGIFIIFFYLIHESIGAIKWGWLSRINGTVYMAFFDHFIYVVMGNMLFINSRYSTLKFMLHLLIIELVSFVLVFIFYKVKMNKLMHKKSSKSSSAKTDKVAEQAKKIKEATDGEKEISPNQFKNLASEGLGKKPRRNHDRKSYSRKMSDLSDDNIDSFLDSFTYENTDEDPDPEIVNEEFDIDGFLGDFQNMHGGHSHSQHRHAPAMQHITLPDEKEKPEEKKEEVVAEKEEAQRKYGWFNRMMDWGNIDDSESNDLI